MVAGYHLIWTAYGFWLPNDPRGSTSIAVREDKLKPLGDVHLGRRTVQPPRCVLRQFFEKAHDLLKHPVLVLDDEAIGIVAQAIGDVIAAKGYTCYACAVMPDHVHLLIRRHRDKAEDMIDHFQTTTRRALIEAKVRAVTHPVWAAGGWKGFLNTGEDFNRAGRYIDKNPAEIGRSRQDWEFVTAYDGWMPAYRG